VTDDGWLETPERGLHELAIGTGEYLAASGFHSIAQSPLAELGRMAGLYAAGSGPNANAPDLPIDPARERIKAVGLDQVLHVDGTSIKAPVLDLMMANAREKREREATIARGPSGIIPTALAVGTSFFAGALDPINVGAAMIPVVGEARAARLLAAAGESIVGRTAVRAGTGGVQGAAGMVPLEGLNWLDHTLEGQDWQMTDALRGIAFGGVLGAGLHASLGALSDRAAPRPGDPIEAAVEHIKAAEGARAEATPVSEIEPVVSEAAPDLSQESARTPMGEPSASGGRDEIAAQVADLPPQAREDAARATLGSLVDGRPVRTAEMLAAAAEHDPRIAESVALPPLHEGVTIVERGGPLGPVLDGLQNRWRDAVAWLRRARTGDARGVLSHPDVPAPIDVVWGDDRGGLAHILRRHPEVADVLPERLAHMRVVERTENRIHLSDGEYVAVVSLNHLGRAKTWLLTAFEGVHRPRSGRGSMGSPSELRGPLTSRAAPGEPNMGGDTGGVETAREANNNFSPVAPEPRPERGRTAISSELRGPLKSRAAPGEPSMGGDTGGVEAAPGANANFRRLAADPLPHNERRWSPPRAPRPRGGRVVAPPAGKRSGSNRAQPRAVRCPPRRRACRRRKAAVANQLRRCWRARQPRRNCWSTRRSRRPTPRNKTARRPTRCPGTGRPSSKPGANSSSIIKYSGATTLL
jgi:hypothetical protein